MRHGLLLLIAIAKIVSADNYDRESAIVKASADLMPLMALNGAPASSAQGQIMAQFAWDINKLHPQGLITRKLAYALTNALARKALTHERLVPLVSGLVTVYDAAASCRVDSCDPQSSTQFRSSGEQIYSALIALGVNSSDAQQLMLLVSQAASRVFTNPLLRPIPAAHPAQLPNIPN